MDFSRFPLGLAALWRSKTLLDPVNFFVGPAHALAERLVGAIAHVHKAELIIFAVIPAPKGLIVIGEVVRPYAARLSRRPSQIPGVGVAPGLFNLSRIICAVTSSPKPRVMDAPLLLPSRKSGLMLP